MTTILGHVTPLRLSQPANLNLAEGCPAQVLIDADWLGAPVETPDGVNRPGTRRYLMDLSLPVREHSPRLTFKKAAYVDLGEARETPQGCAVDISWQSSSLAPLFPVFAGRIVLSRTEIALEGYYAPPGGEVGAVLDRAFFNIAARGTARWLLEQIVATLAASTAPQPAEGARSAAMGRAGGS